MKPDGRARGWLRRHIPSRETIDSYRLLRPFAKQLQPARSLAPQPPLGAARRRARARRRRHHPVHARRHRRPARDPGAGQCRDRRRLHPGRQSAHHPANVLCRLSDRHAGSCATTRSADPAAAAAGVGRARRGCCSGCTMRRGRSRSASSPSPLARPLAAMSSARWSGGCGCAANGAAGAMRKGLDRAERLTRFETAAACYSRAHPSLERDESPMRKLVFLSLTAATALATASRRRLRRGQATPRRPPPPAGPQYGTFGFDAAGMDRSVAPGRQFLPVRQRQLGRRPREIPADKAITACSPRSTICRAAAPATILEEAARTIPSSARSATVYASFMDEAAIEAKGIAPIQPLLDRIRGLQSTGAGYAALVAEARRIRRRRPVRRLRRPGRQGIPTYMRCSRPGRPRPARPRLLSQRRCRRSPRRAPPIRPISRNMLTLAGESECRRARRRDPRFRDADRRRPTGPASRTATPSKTYNKMARGRARARRAGLRLGRLFPRARRAGADRCSSPSRARFTGIAAADRRGAARRCCKDYLLVRIARPLRRRAAAAISSTRISPSTAPSCPARRSSEERWKRARRPRHRRDARRRQQALRPALLPARRPRRAADALVHNIIAAMDRAHRPARLDERRRPRQRARAKLAAFTPKIGYPDLWRDYSSLGISRDDALGNAMRAGAVGASDFNVAQARQARSTAANGA